MTRPAPHPSDLLQREIDEANERLGWKPRCSDSEALHAELAQAAAEIAAMSDEQVRGRGLGVAARRYGRDMAEGARLPRRGADFVTHEHGTRSPHWCEECQGSYPCSARQHRRLSHPSAGVLRWRQRRWWSWLSRQFYASGIASSGCHSSHPDGWIVRNFYRGKRPYVLWIKREAWGHPWHRLRTGHWPEVVMLGMCGKCAPWVCCGATGFDHAEDCDKPEQRPGTPLPSRASAAALVALQALVDAVGDEDAISGKTLAAWTRARAVLAEAATLTAPEPHPADLLQREINDAKAKLGWKPRGSRA